MQTRRSITLLLVAAVVCCFAAPLHAKLIASFSADMQAGGLPHGSNTSNGLWIYGWNSVGAVGDPLGTFEWLQATDDSRFLYDTDGVAGLPDSAPGAFTYMGFVDTEQTEAGGHPGQGSGQNEFERFVMALFYLPEDGNFAIRDSVVRLADPEGHESNSDGLSFFAGVLGDIDVVGLVNPGFGNSGSFDTSLGYHTAGEFVIVGIGSRITDSFDSFALDFDIVSVPAPGTLGLLGAGLFGLGFMPRKRSA